jgi:formylglycine-generating enzyme required for sulfatase activity
MLRTTLISSGVALALACGASAQTGTTFCAATANSSGAPALLTGSFATPAQWDLHLEVTQGVSAEIGYMLSGPEVTSGVTISNGLLCLVGTPTARFYRYNVNGGEWNSVGRFDSAGVLQNLAGTSTTGSGYDVPPTVPDTVPVTIMAGDTWHFQLWYRDTPAGQGTSNFSTGLSVTFGSLQPVAGMVQIPTGTFDMGSSAASGLPYLGSFNTQPVHSVTISQGFWMGEHEVTQAEYQALMGVNPSAFLGANLPVERVSWYDARAYCTALTAQEMALGNVPVGYEYRLPTEAEWEYACRAGTTTEFHVGADLFCADARFGTSYHSGSSCGSNTTVDVGGYPANAFGLFDMHGNVQEWCLDSFASYSSGAATDPLVTGGSGRVFRGGGWNGSSAYCRSAYRSNNSPDSSHSAVGFRVVLAQVLDYPPAPVPGMVAIPAGTFDMGSNAPLHADPYYNNSFSQPVHSVTISQGFLMGEHEVTQAEYQALMGVNPSNFTGANLPVEQVDWSDARDYCTALTAQEMALGNVPAGYEYRLPTEAEWEFACRAGTTTEFNVGADLYCADARFDYSWHSNSSCSAGSTVDVGGYPANAFGLYDMHGNVTEWCLDSWVSYSSGAATDPFLTGNSDKVLRGGSWNDNSNYSRSAYRNRSRYNTSFDFVGFRVVLAQVLVP